MVPFDRLHIFY